MIRTWLRGLLVRICEWWQPADPDERIRGSGQVYLDPAYNGRYTAERRLQNLAETEAEAQTERERDGDHRHDEPPF